MKGVIVGIGLVMLALGAAPVSVAAQDGAGLAGIHAWVKAAGKTCMADHFHDGQGTGSTKAQSTINPAIVAEFAHVVYRFGHSMLLDVIDRLDPEFASSE